MNRKSRVEKHLTNEQSKLNEECGFPDAKQNEQPVKIKQTETATAEPKARREPEQDKGTCNVCKKIMYTKNLKRHYKNCHDVEISYTAVCCD